MVLIYIAGYVAEKMIEERTTLTQTFTFRKYTEELNRGGLTLPADEICQWVIYSYIMFHQVVRVVCRTSLLNILMVIAEFHNFNIEKKHGRILSNILFNNHCHLFNPRSSKEPKQKILKLSNLVFYKGYFYIHTSVKHSFLSVSLLFVFSPPPPPLPPPHITPFTHIVAMASGRISVRPLVK